MEGYLNLSEDIWWVVDGEFTASYWWFWVLLAFSFQNVFYG